VKKERGEAYKQTVYIVPKSKIESRAHYATSPHWPLSEGEKIALRVVGRFVCLYSVLWVETIRTPRAGRRAELTTSHFHLA